MSIDASLVDVVSRFVGFKLMSSSCYAQPHLIKIFLPNYLLSQLKKNWNLTKPNRKKTKTKFWFNFDKKPNWFEMNLALMRGVIPCPLTHSPNIQLNLYCFLVVNLNCVVKCVLCLYTEPLTKGIFIFIFIFVKNGDKL